MIVTNGKFRADTTTCKSSQSALVVHYQLCVVDKYEMRVKNKE